MLRVCLIEAVEKPEDAGSIGVYFIEQAVKRAGHTVERIAWDCPRYCYDVELISVHHPANYAILPRIPRHARIRIIGGHVTYTNPRPIIPLCDAVCLGDGEAWIVEVLAKIDRDRQYLDTIDRLDGGIVTRTWQRGAAIPACSYLPSIAGTPTYLNRDDTLSATWYIEIARGCPYRCDYCGLGHTMPYRYRPLDDILSAIDAIDASVTKKISLMAPDAASHPQYSDILAYAYQRGLHQLFGSYRLDRILTVTQWQTAHRQLLRLGVDGLTESTRKRVHKPITNEQILLFFRTMIAQGFVSFKLFQMFAHSWEQLEDFAEWEAVMSQVFQIPHDGMITLRVKWTPLVPQLGTPLAHDAAHYSAKMASRIKTWHHHVAGIPGWNVSCDGMMSAKSHAKQCELAQLTETDLLHNAAWIHPAWRRFE